MAHDVSIDIAGLPRLQRKVTLIRNSIFSIKLMTELGFFAMTKIKKRTAAGRDVDGVPFMPYSEKYTMFRRKHGRPTSRVDLFFHGDMMSSMTTDTESDKVEIYFQNTTDQSGVENPKKAFFLNEDRNFFALSDEDIRQMIRIVNNYYRRLMR